MKILQQHAIFSGLGCILSHFCFLVQSSKPQKYPNMEIIRAKLNLASLDAYVPPEKHIQNPNSERLGNFFYEAFCEGQHT